MRSVYAFLTIGCTILTATAHGLPKEGKVVAGSGSIDGKGKDHLHVTAADKAIIHWKEFSIGAGERVEFLQPSSSSVVLNRVKGGSASHILGQLHANGKVYLINRSGIIFGKDAIVKTSDFLASTHDITDESFLLGKELLFGGDSKEALINYGTIETSEGNITLLGRFVENHGLLKAPHGQVSLAAGQEIILQFEETPLLTIRASLIPDGHITEAGQIEALMVDLQSEGGAASHGINIQGTILALEPVEEQGRIYLKSDGIAIATSGHLEASTIELDAGAKGLYMEGSALASEGSISVVSDASGSPSFHLGTFDVSGPKGGTIAIQTGPWINSGALLANGTDGKGGEIEIHAHGSYVETQKGVLSADGAEEGGTIALQSDVSLFSSGTFSSQGLVGGEISFVAPTLTLVSAEINAEGLAGGGKVYVGSDATLETRVGGDTHIAANGGKSGQGGTIVVWAEEKTICYGSLEAKGGIHGGNGGFIEVSGLGDLCCRAALDASAQEGLPGTVLLDPKNITVSLTADYPQYALLDPDPASGPGFGENVSPLSTGNIVVAKPGYMVDIGAVYVYNGLTAALVSSLTGDASGDQVNSGGLFPLAGKENFVIPSPNWHGGRGAVTWGSGVTGVNGVISLSNSLVGSIASDSVSSNGIVSLTNGNYVVQSPSALNGQGAVTWGNGMTGTSGVVSGLNSIIGIVNTDLIGSAGVFPSPNGDYVIASPFFENPVGNIVSAGAVTLADGLAPSAFTVDPANSLVGTHESDQVGSGALVVLTNNNYVVISEFWNGGAGAVTWCSSNGTTVGDVDATNSLVGSAMTDGVGSRGVVILRNSSDQNYVVLSPDWSGTLGAATWGSGTGGVSGPVSAGNSLIGTALGDRVGNSVVVELTSGNYVVLSPNCANGIMSGAGAATWVNGMTGAPVGAVTASNSLVGSAKNDHVGGGPAGDGNEGAAPLTNGHFVVLSPEWSGLVGAASWGNGTNGQFFTGSFGAVSAVNSIVGTTVGDRIGDYVTPLTNGNYVTGSISWFGGMPNSGAVRWGDGAGGTFGAVTSGNSLVGVTSGDMVGEGGINVLSTNHYVVVSPSWSSGATGLGAVTWGDGDAGGTRLTGNISSANSFIGATMDDHVGGGLGGGVTVLANGNYVVLSPLFDVDGVIVDAGAVTLGNGQTGTFFTAGAGPSYGVLSAENSLVGGGAEDFVGRNNIGSPSITELANSTYVVVSSEWGGDGILANTFGAATWGDGATGAGTVGTLSGSNSLIGTNKLDRVGFGGVTMLTSGPYFGNYVVKSPHWHSTVVPGGIADAGAVTWGNGTTGIVGPVTPQNSVVGTVALAGLAGVLRDNVNDTFLCPFLTGGPLASGQVIAGLQDPIQITFARGENQTMGVPPSFFTDTLNTGSAVVLQANNDISIDSPITTTGSGALTLVAGRSVLLNADITTAGGALTVMANDPSAISSARDAGAAVLTIASGVTIDTGTADLALTLADGDSGDVTLGDSVTLRTAGSGSLTITAADHNIVLGDSVLLSTENGLLQLTAGIDIVGENPLTIETTGTGELILLSDNLFPISPAFGNGAIRLGSATLTTGGGKLLIYTAERSLDVLPATINGVPFVQGPEFVDSATEKWGVYYPSSSGIPFTVFYKQTGSPVPPNPPPPNPPPLNPPPLNPPPLNPQGNLERARYDAITAATAPFTFWFNPWYNDLYFAVDRYPPYLTQKALRLRLPSLVYVDRDLDWLP